MKLCSRGTRLLATMTGLSGVLLAFATTTAFARSDLPYALSAGKRFLPIASFDVMAGNGSSVAEIVDASRDGKQLIYTDAGNGEIGFVDIAQADKPKGQGVLVLGGEPTSLAIVDPLVLVAVDTSESYSNPSGKLVVVDRNTRTVVAQHPLPGQPDSVALSPDRTRAAIVIENERDEDENDGLLPQYPGGALLIVDLVGAPTAWRLRSADLAPVAAAAVEGSDLEPEFVDINDQNEAVVTFQENNHIAIVDLRTGRTIRHFSAGAVTLRKVDTVEEDLITLDDQLTRRREPDAVAWIGRDTFAVANEGDYTNALDEEGGSRGFTVFNRNGRVVYESGPALEHALVSAGHFNEGRSQNKGIEPEAVEFGKFGAQELLFVGAERANVVAVYELERGRPTLVQLLPTGISPEGLKAIPGRELLVAATETAAADAGIPTMINLYAREQASRRGTRLYPMLASAYDSHGLPIPWVALSGLVGDRFDRHKLYAVSDAFLAEGFIYTIDVAQTPARIVDRLQVTGAGARLDLEGIAVGPDGDFWLGSEGAAPGGLENRVLKVDSTSGAVTADITLPADLVDQRRSNGIEGIAVTGTAGAEVIYVAIQRAWPNEGDADRVNTKIGRYEVATGQWSFVQYPLQPQGNGDWLGLSELTLLPDGTFAVIERDKGWGRSTGLNAELKAVYRVDLAEAEFRAYGDPNGLVTVNKSLLIDVLPALEKHSIWTAEKLEGFAVTADRRMYAVTDNDGLDDAPGETVFLRLGKLR